MKTKKSILEQGALLIALIAVGIIPILVRVTQVNYPMSKYSWYPNVDVFFDIYTYFKSNCVIALGVMALIYLSITILKKRDWSKIKKDVVLALIAFLFIWVIVSTFFSTDLYMSLHGYIDRYESIWVWFSYFLIFMVIYSHSWNEKEAILVNRAFILLNLILSIIGLGQYFHVDVLFNPIVKPFLTSFSLINSEFNIGSAYQYNRISQTLFNSNQVGYFCSFSIPYFLNLLLNEREPKKRYFYFAFTGLLLFNLFGSIARNGLIAVAFTVPLILYLNREKFLKYFKSLKWIVLGVVAVILVGSLVMNSFIIERFGELFNPYASEQSIESIMVEGNDIKINYMASELKIAITAHSAQGWVMNYYLDDQLIEPSGIDELGRYVFDQQVLNGVSVFLQQVDSNVYFVVNMDQRNWYFGYNGDQLSYVNIYQKFDKIEKPQSIGFKGIESMGTGRFYIWSRTLPLILNHPVVGNGVDTFASQFPQEDYVGKHYIYHTTDMVVDKVHNLYLQIAYDFGLPAIIAFLALLLIYYKRFIRRNIKDDGFLKSFNISICIGITGYLVASMFNDSSVHTAPIFWAFLALSFSLVKPIAYEKK
ncbi:O-antigen ligase family protein [Fusibacter ferrireducens]|uniref:O-antigen ligase family protein n=1 Tax=Fusibacter ferrireducens TaxID=2785058 RepID=A0ABR9ZXC4_9FIRM|nr:O-antigen ligase family protein [Fusibacter ferrireducens]MBF4695120.1 O-antigen ligase family protein [Fusibacter ferrireducens]